MTQYQILNDNPQKDSFYKTLLGAFYFPLDMGEDQKIKWKRFRIGCSCVADEDVENGNQGRVSIARVSRTIHSPYLVKSETREYICWVMSEYRYVYNVIVERLLPKRIQHHRDYYSKDRGCYFLKFRPDRPGKGAEEKVFPVSVAGYDDIDFAAYCNPPLSTVRVRAFRMGEMAV